MTKLAILLMLEGSHTTVGEADREIMPILHRFPQVYGRNGTSVKIARWNPEDGLDARLHAGRFVYFLSKGISQDGQMAQEEVEQIPVPTGFWSWFKKMAKEEMNKPIGVNKKPSPEGRIKG